MAGTFIDVQVDAQAAKDAVLATKLVSELPAHGTG